MNADNRLAADLTNLEARLSKLEKASRRWRLLCFAMMILAVGMGAKFAAQDAEFGVVKAKKFFVVNDSGDSLGVFQVSGAGESQSAEIAIRSSDKKRATAISPGTEIRLINN
jgi:hypothetical protein